MKIEFDPAKDVANVAKHGLSLTDAAAFDFEEAYVELDDRHDYGELRYRAFGRVASLGHCLAFTVRGSVARLISYRRAHEKEMQRYGK